MAKQRQTCIDISSAFVCRGHECHFNIALWPDWEQTAIRISKGALRVCSDGIDIYWNDLPGKFTHRDAAKRTKIFICPKCIWPQPGGRDVEISTPTGKYLPTTLIIQSLVKLFLLSWTCMTLYTLMMRWKDSLHNEITGFYDPICTLIKTMSSRSTVRHFIKTRQVTELDDIFLVLLTLGQQW